MLSYLYVGFVHFQAVKRIDHFIRKRSYNVRVEILSVLLSLRIKNVKPLDEELESKNIAKKKLTHTEKLMRKLIEERKPQKSRKEAKVNSFISKPPLKVERIVYYEIQTT